ncbi:mediator of RNA polymerase II transcription subunit 27 [Tanacetum coccineum]
MPSVCLDGAVVAYAWNLLLTEPELEKEVPDVNTFTYEQLDWSKRSSLLARSSSETLDEPPKDHGFNKSRDIRSGSEGVVASDQIIVIELFLPTVFRAASTIIEKLTQIRTAHQRRFGEKNGTNETQREGVEDLLDKLRSIKRDGGIQGDARDAYVESQAEDHFDGILKTTLSPQGFSKRIGIHTIQSISGFAAQDALLSRHWSINNRTIIYVPSGDGQVQVVSNNDVNLQSGEVVVVGKKQKARKEAEVYPHGTRELGSACRSGNWWGEAMQVMRRVKKGHIMPN